ncbi:hypothetical protein HOD08_05370 [bacterium]|nr:hypothetical protein [bacterium]
MKKSHLIFLLTLASCNNTIAGPPDSAKSFTPTAEKSLTETKLRLDEILWKSFENYLTHENTLDALNKLKNECHHFFYEALQLPYLSSGIAPAMYAVTVQRMETSIFLFKLGTNVRTIDSQESNILHLVAKHAPAKEIRPYMMQLAAVATTQQFGIEHMLIKKNKFGITPYHALQIRAEYNPAVAEETKIWFTKHMDVMQRQIQNKTGNNHLHVLAFLNAPIPLELIEQFRPNMQTHLGYSPIKIALECGHTHMAAFLMRHTPPYRMPDTQNPAQFFQTTMAPTPCSSNCNTTHASHVSYGPGRQTFFTGSHFEPSERLRLLIKKGPVSLTQKQPRYSASPSQAGLISAACKEQQNNIASPELPTPCSSSSYEDTYPRVALPGKTLPKFSQEYSGLALLAEAVEQLQPQEIRDGNGHKRKSTSKEKPKKKPKKQQLDPKNGILCSTCICRYKTPNTLFTHLKRTGCCGSTSNGIITKALQKNLSEYYGSACKRIIVSPRGNFRCNLCEAEFADYERAVVHVRDEHEDYL